MQRRKHKWIKYMPITSNDTIHSSYVHEVVECSRAFSDAELNSVTCILLVDFVVLGVMSIA